MWNWNCYTTFACNSCFSLCCRHCYLHFSICRSLSLLLSKCHCVLSHIFFTLMLNFYSTEQCRILSPQCFVWSWVTIFSIFKQVGASERAGERLNEWIQQIRTKQYIFHQQYLYRKTCSIEFHFWSASMEVCVWNWSDCLLYCQFTSWKWL